MTAPAPPSQFPERLVIELECGVTVYPARPRQGRWRAVWYENGPRQQCEAVTEAKLTPKLEKIVERLQADAPNMRQPGADLIAHYLDPDRLPVPTGGRASTPTPSGGCASGSPPRSSPRSPARTSRPGTPRRSSTPRPRPGKATGCTGCSPPSSRPGSMPVTSRAPAGEGPLAGRGPPAARSSGERRG